MTLARALDVLSVLTAVTVAILAILLPPLLERETGAVERKGEPSFKTRIVMPIVLAAVLLAGFFARSYLDRPAPPAGQPPLPERVLAVPGGPLTVEIAASDLERQRGLSDRNGLAADKGMLFLFDEPKPYAFWMKDMRFSIDIVYLSSGVVTQVFAHVPPPGPGEPPKTVVPDGRADAVLEVFAGESARRGWGPGTRLLPPAEAR